MIRMTLWSYTTLTDATRPQIAVVDPMWNVKGFPIDEDRDNVLTRGADFAGGWLQPGSRNGAHYCRDFRAKAPRKR